MNENCTSIKPADVQKMNVIARYGPNYQAGGELTGHGSTHASYGKSVVGSQQHEPDETRYKIEESKTASGTISDVHV